MKVHIVLGSADCYSDWREWVAKVFCTEAAAKRWAESTQEKVRDIIEDLECNRKHNWDEREEAMRQILELDPQSKADVWEAGTNRYTVVAQELEGAKGWV